MLRKRCFCLQGLISLLLLVCTHTNAQIDTTKTQDLSEVEITAKSRPSATRSSAPIQLLDKKSIEMLGVQDLSEAIKRFSGITVQDYGGVGGLKTVSVRSLGAKHTAVSYDGITITDAQSGQVDISRFSLDNVGMISLSIGQTDDIFQTARMYASAGALSIQTSAPEFTDKSFNLKGKIKGGSFGLINPSVNYEQKLGSKWSASVYENWTKSNGEYPFTLVNGNQITEETRRNSDITSLRLEANIYGNLGNAGDLKAKVYYYDSERGLPGSVILYNNTSNERLWDNNFFTQVNYTKAFSDMWKIRADLKYNYSFSKYLDVNDKYADGFQKDLNTQNEYYASLGALFCPLSGLSFSLNSDIARAMLDNNYMNSPMPKRWTSLTALAAQYKNSRITATASVLGTYITDEVEYGDKPDDRKRLSPALSLSWRPFEEQNLRVRASFKDAFRVPTFTDLYYLRMGNTNLVPEKATQYNIGLTWSEHLAFFSLINISADAYYNKVKDKIVALPTLYIWKMMNFGEVDIKGVDINFNSEIPLYDKIVLSLSSAYSYQYAVDVTDKSAKNYKHQIPYTPRHSGSVSAMIENPWVNISYSLIATGDRYALPQNIESNLIKSYMEHTISANRSFTIKNKVKLRLQGEIVNLTNKTYEVIQYYPMPGRSWRLSLGIEY